MNRRRLHEIVESVKEDYLLGAIEETTNEVEVLKTKKFLNETSAIVESMLIEEGFKDFIKDYIDVVGDGARAMKEGYGAIGNAFKDAFNPNSRENKYVRKDMADSLRKHNNAFSQKAADFIEPEMDMGEKAGYFMNRNPYAKKARQLYANAKANAIIGSRKIGAKAAAAGQAMVDQAKAHPYAAAGLGAAGLAGAGYAGYEAGIPEDIADQIQNYMS